MASMFHRKRYFFSVISSFFISKELLLTHETSEKLHLLQPKQKVSTHAFAFKWILLVLKKHRTNPNIGKDHFALSGELQKHMRTNFGEKRQKHQLLQKSYAQAEILTAPARNI